MVVGFWGSFSFALISPPWPGSGCTNVYPHMHTYSCTAVWLYDCTAARPHDRTAVRLYSRTAVPLQPFCRTAEQPYVSKLPNLKFWASQDLSRTPSQGGSKSMSKKYRLFVCLSGGTLQFLRPPPLPRGPRPSAVGAAATAGGRPPRRQRRPQKLKINVF